MFYYRCKSIYMVSNHHVSDSTLDCELALVTEEEISKTQEAVYVLNFIDPLYSRKRAHLSHEDLAFLSKEGLELLLKPGHKNLPLWLKEKIYANKAISLNTAYPGWIKELDYKAPKKWRLNIAGLGDVGGTLATGLRLLGRDVVSSIGIYDIDPNKVARWEYELNQIHMPFESSLPQVVPLDEASLFDCDMFAFCVTLGVPPLGENATDVRIAQFEGNARIIKAYAKQAREAGFKGIFAVVSDPVDLLCKAAFLESNRDENGDLDFLGLSADQIRGYGLGVMNARALYYAKLHPHCSHYEREGRAFGPHGEGLVIADSIENYNEDDSLFLTDKARHANLEVRKTGYKPYIAPAYSSGCLSLLATIKGDWHYSATYMGGVYMGSKNRLTSWGTELERLDLPHELYKRLEKTYKDLGAWL